MLLALVCALVALVPASAVGRRRSARPARSRTFESATPLPAGHGTRGVAEEHVHVRRGETLGGLLAARGVGPTEARPWLAAAAEVFDVRGLAPRRGLTLRFDRATHALLAIHYEIDGRTLLVVERARESIHAERTALPYFIEVKGAAGRIARGLRDDATGAGVPARIVSELADIFGWELELESDLRPGDEFRVLYENTWQAGTARPEPGNVLGAEIVAHGRPLVAVFFEDEDGRGAYYHPSGDPLSRELLRYPVEFTEITSEFSLMRPHPILRRPRPHLGVDFAAPLGTPVRAVAEGMVSEAGWLGELGRCIRIDHAGSLTSSYGHLARIADGVRAGHAVERGQVIGYVGSSGLATGPHLHFAMHRGGEYVDPIALTATAGTRLPESARRLFGRVQRGVRRQLAALPETGRPLTVSLSSSALRAE
jgi:murein DD-endopeptidase MepM/ murein hydrolase activator NlpD